MGVSVERKALAKYLRSMLGGSPTVAKYWDAAEESSVDILSARDVPATGVTAYATLGLSDYSIDLEVGGIALRVEFIMAAGSCYECTPSVLATCAFNVINSKMPCQPGQVFSRVVEMYRPESEMKHILLAPPFLWELETQEFAEKKVAWLQAVPVSDNEYALAREKGSDVLEKVFEQRQIDAFDLDRKSVV